LFSGFYDSVRDRSLTMRCSAYEGCQEGREVSARFF